MLEWYKDEQLSIFFSNIPWPRERFILPCMDEDEKEFIKEYPYINMTDLEVAIFDHLNKKSYHFIIPEGYYSDGASIPGLLLKTVIGAKTDNRFLIAAMVHDWMCEYHAVVNYDRNLSSRIFRALLITGGTSKTKAQIMYLGVDNFQRFQGWNPEQDKKDGAIMAMTLGINGINLIKKFEGLKLTAYKCPSGVWTIGWGHTAGVKEGDVITQEQAEQLFLKDMKIYESHVNKLVAHKLNQNQFDALVSFCYNCGAGNLQKLTKNKTLEQIGQNILLYNKSRGKVLNGLVRRRNEEQKLFLTPVGQINSEKYKVTAFALNVRAGIGTSYKIVRVLKKDAVVNVLYTSNGWGKISDGWVSMKYVKKV